MTDSKNKFFICIPTPLQCLKLVYFELCTLFLDDTITLFDILLRCTLWLEFEDTFIDIIFSEAEMVTSVTK